MSNYYGEYDESKRDEDWYALGYRDEYESEMYGRSRRPADDYGYDYDESNWAFDRYDWDEEV